MSSRQKKLENLIEVISRRLRIFLERGKKTEEVREESTDTDQISTLGE